MGGKSSVHGKASAYLMGSKFYQLRSITVQETQAFSEAWNLAQCILNSILRDYGHHKCAV